MREGWRDGRTTAAGAGRKKRERENSAEVEKGQLMLGSPHVTGLWQAEREKRYLIMFQTIFGFVYYCTAVCGCGVCACLCECDVGCVLACVCVYDCVHRYVLTIACTFR